MGTRLRFVLYSIEECYVATRGLPPIAAADRMKTDLSKKRKKKNSSASKRSTASTNKSNLESNDNEMPGGTQNSTPTEPSSATDAGGADSVMPKLLVVKSISPTPFSALNINTARDEANELKRDALAPQAFDTMPMLQHQDVSITSSSADTENDDRNGSLSTGAGESQQQVAPSSLYVQMPFATQAQSKLTMPRSPITTSEPKTVLHPITKLAGKSSKLVENAYVLRNDAASVDNDNGYVLRNDAAGMQPTFSTNTDNIELEEAETGYVLKPRRG